MRLRLEIIRSRLMEDLSFVFLCIVFKYNCKHNADKQILAFKWCHLLLVGHALNRSCLTKTSTRNEL